MSEQRKKGSRRCALGRGAAASPGMRFTPWAASSESLKKTLRLAAVSGLHGHPQRGPLCSKHAPSVSAKSAPSHAVPALPGTLQSHSSRFVEPSGITRGRAAKPNGWSCCVSSGQAQGAPTRLAQGASSGAKRNLLLCRALAPCATHGAPQRGDQLLCPPSGERVCFVRKPPVRGAFAGRGRRRQRCGGVVDAQGRERNWPAQQPELTLNSES